MRILFILFICLGTLLPAQAAPKQEIRASWITTLGGLDWPSQKATSPQALNARKRIMQYIGQTAGSQFQYGAVPDPSARRRHLSFCPGMLCRIPDRTHRTESRL